MLTSEIKVINYRNQNMAVLLNVIASTVYKVCKMHENVGIKAYNFFRFLVCYNILTLPSIICADKRSGGFKISSWYFIKLLSIPKYRNYRPSLVSGGQTFVFVLTDIQEITHFRSIIQDYLQFLVQVFPLVT